jgi:hypothetical protein
MKGSGEAVFFVAGILMALVFLTACVMDNLPASVQNQTPPKYIVTTHIPTTITTLYDEKINDNQISESAKELIREFSKNSSLDLKSGKISHQPYADLYRFDATDHSFYTVNNVTGRVQSANWYEVGSKSQKEIIDLDQGYTLAESYTREKFPEFWNISDTRGIKVMRKEALDRGMDRQFNYEWWEIFYTPDKNELFRTEIPGLNSVSATLSPYTGHVISYYESYNPLVISGSPPVNLTPELTEDQAKAISEKEFTEMGVPPFSQENTGIIRLRISNREQNIPHLVWNFGKDWTEGSSRNFAIVSVDAHDGTIVWSVKSGNA